MSGLSQYSTGQLILRSLQPSAGSAFLCILAAVLLVGINVVLQSVSEGTALPGVFDGQWAMAYTENIVQPLSELLSSNTLNKLIVAILWGAAGFGVYIGFEYLIHWSRSLRESRTDIRMARNHVIEHPLAQTFWTAVWWRVGVIIAGIIFLVLVQPLLRNALGIAQVVLFSEDLLVDSWKIILAVGEWAFLLHSFVVFLRLYTMRTRLFGDDALY